MANFNEQSPLVKLCPLFIYLCKIIDVVFSNVFVVFHKKHLCLSGIGPRKQVHTYIFKFLTIFTDNAFSMYCLLFY